MRRSVRLGAVVVPLLSVGAFVRCAGAPQQDIVSPADPKAPAAASNVLTVTRVEATTEDVDTVVPTAEGAPRVVFKIKPGADANGVIGGSGSPDKPLNVTFNTCASVDPDNDPLLYSIDVDGNGTLDDQGTTGGHCRQTIPYAAEAGEPRRIRPTVCVVDLDAAGQPRRERVCKTYTIEVFSKGEPLPWCGTGPGWAATGDFASPSCTCTNGVSFPFLPGPLGGSFADLCFTSGFSGAQWSLLSGTCSCF